MKFWNVLDVTSCGLVVHDQLSTAEAEPVPILGCSLSRSLLAGDVCVSGQANLVIHRIVS